MYRLDISTGQAEGAWEVVQVHGENITALCLHGHTTVYDPHSDSLIIYGGRPRLTCPTYLLTTHWPLVLLIWGFVNNIHIKY